MLTIIQILWELAGLFIRTAPAKRQHTLAKVRNAFRTADAPLPDTGEPSDDTSAIEDLVNH